MIATADILAALKQRWAQVAELTALVPGGLHHQRVAEKLQGGVIGSPYAAITITEGQAEFNSSATYTQPFQVDLRWWTPFGNVDGGLIAKEIDHAFHRDRHGLFVAGADKVIDLKPTPGELVLDDKRVEGTDVMAGRRSWELVIQASNA